MGNDLHAYTSRTGWSEYEMEWQRGQQTAHATLPSEIYSEMNGANDKNKNQRPNSFSERWAWHMITFIIIAYLFFRKIGNLYLYLC